MKEKDKGGFYEEEKEERKNSFSSLKKKVSLHSR